MRNLSLRTRIVTVFVAIYGTVFVVLLGWLMLHIEQDFTKEVDANLRGMVADIENVLSRGPDAVDSLRTALHQTRSFMSMQEHIWLSLGDSTIYRCNHLTIREFPHDARNTHPITIDAGEQGWFRLIQTRAGPYTIRIGQEITAMEHTLHESMIIFLISIPLVIALSFVGGYYLVRRLLRPLDVIMRRAQRISSENLSERIPQPGSYDEIDRVVTTLNEMIGRLERSFLQLEQFTANASHELRTPLTILKGEIEVALQQVRDEREYHAVLESNLEEVGRIANTVEQLFLLARIDANAIDPVLEPVLLKPLLEEIVRDAAVLAGDNSVRVESALDDVPVVQGDTVMLVQLFLNLVENGVKYNRPGGMVRVSLATERPMAETVEARAMATRARGVRIEVSDTGIGIPQESIGSVFDRFYRVDRQRSRLRGGAGLGLSIASWIVRMHGGSIDVRSREGEGSVFTVRLPFR